MVDGIYLLQAFTAVGSNCIDFSQSNVCRATVCASFHWVASGYFMKCATVAGGGVVMLICFGVL